MIEGNDRKVLAKAAYLAVVLLAMAGALSVYFATTNGPWMASDSVEYVVSADNLRAGKGLGLERPSGEFAPMSHFPPGYSLVLAALGVVTGNGIDAARVASVLLMLVFGLLLGLGTLSALQSPPLAIIMTMVPITSTVFLNLFTGALSEPLFLVLLCAGTYSLARWLAFRMPADIVLSALALGLAAVTRYAGMPLIPAGAVVVLAFSGSSWQRRLRDAAVHLLLGVLPVGLWFGWLAWLPSAAQARGFTVPDLSVIWETSQPMRGAMVESLWRSVPYGEWLPELPYAARAGILALGAALTVLIPARWMTRGKEAVRRSDAAATCPQCLALVSWAFAVCYVAGLALAWLLVSPTPDINLRMMAPGAILLWWLLASGISLLRSQHTEQRWLGNIGLVAAGLYMATLVPRGAELLQDLHINGRGYSSVIWRSSPTIPVLVGMPTDVSIVTNESAAVMLLAGRSAYDLPEIVRNERVELSRPFGENEANPQERLFRKGKAVLVLFRSLYWQLEPLYGPNTDERIRILTEGLTIELKTSDAMLYRWSGP